MRYSLSSDTAPQSPVSLAEMKAWLKDPPSVEDPLIDRLLQTAAGAVEEMTGVVYTSRSFTYKAQSDRLTTATRITLPRKPVTAITAVTAIDYDGTEEALVLDTDYYGSAEVLTLEARSLAAGGLLRVAFTAGSDTVPQAVHEAIKRLVTDWYGQRGSYRQANLVQDGDTAEDILHRAGLLRMTV